jgi:sugar phosphate isomerase/epimerase
LAVESVDIHMHPVKLIPLVMAVCCLAAPFASNAGVGLPSIPSEWRTGGFAIGCQAYSFNRFTVFEAIEKSAQAGGRVIEFYPGQKLSKESPNVSWDHNAPDAVIAQVQSQLTQFRVKAVNYGVVGIPNNEAEARKIFEFARKLGLRAVTTESTESMDVIEKLVKEFGIGVGFHNHPRQPNNPNYKVWSPEYIAQLVKGRDPRIGACADTGHWTRSGIKPADALKLLKGRIISVHLKDLNQFGNREAHDVPFGTGVSDVPAILNGLTQQGFEGNLSIEYEYNWDQSVPEIAQCIGYVRGYGSPRR